MVTGEPGFIQVIDEHSIKIATRLSPSDPLFGNLATERHIGLFAPDFATARRIRVNGLAVIRDGQIDIRAHEVYGNCRRYMQERIFLGARPVPSGQSKPARASVLSAEQQLQISQSDTFFIATDNPEYGADVSHKGGNPGFVRILDQRRIAYPDYNGNSMFNTLGNLTVNPRAGLLFIDFDSGRTLQLTGSASIDWTPERVREFEGAERVVDYDIAEVIGHPSGFPLLSKFRHLSRFNP